LRLFLTTVFFVCRILLSIIFLIENMSPELNEIVRRSGVARSKVSAVKNGATVSVSCDLLVKIVGATGVEVQPNAA
jgi:predicted XRE-type DNA-binding protein